MCRKEILSEWLRNRTGTGKLTFFKFSGTERGTGTAGTVFIRNQNWNREPGLSIQTLLKCKNLKKTLSTEEPSEPQTGTARTVPCTNSSTTQPNHDHPVLCKFGRILPGDSWMIRAHANGSYSRKDVLLPSRCLLESPFLEPLLRSLLRTLPRIKTHCKTPSKNPFLEPSRKQSRELRRPTRKPRHASVLN